MARAPPGVPGVLVGCQAFRGLWEYGIPPTQTGSGDHPPLKVFKNQSKNVNLELVL